MLTSDERTRVEEALGHSMAMRMAGDRRKALLNSRAESVTPALLFSVTRKEASIGRLLEEDVEWLAALVRRLTDEAE